MATNPYAQRLALVASAEHRDYSGILETDSSLKKRIYDVYLADLDHANPDDELGWDMSSDITSWAWSATFVSWCVLESGAFNADFDFSIRHAKYIKFCIANGDNGSGTFRARKLDDYSPQVGDLICGNRGGGQVTFGQARTLDSYNSHGAIVVELTVQDGVHYAVTIGGNEGDSIRKTMVRLTQQGRVKQRGTDPYICVIQNLMDAVHAAPPPAEAHVDTGGAVPAVSILPPSMSKHGTFVYDPRDTITKYGSAKNVALAAQGMGMSHAWLRVHGRTPPTAAIISANQALADAFRDEGIAVAGWGWCQGENPVAEAAMAVRETQRIGLVDYIADIEPGHNNSMWTSTDIRKFCDGIKSHLDGGQFCVSAFALLDWHEPHLYAAALPYVDAFAPQIYWFNFPNSKMLAQFRPPAGGSYTKDSAASYADLCLDRWRLMMGSTPKPLILTGQAYWDEGGFSQQDAEAKLQEFLDDWRGYNGISALNWWHMGGGSSMSFAMRESIRAADLANKPYAP